jgi:hypothetical protein
MKKIIGWAIAALVALHCGSSATAETAVADSIGPSSGIDLPVFWWDQFRPPEGRRQSMDTGVPLADGGILMVAYEGVPLGASWDERLNLDNYRVLLIRTDAAGEEIWRRRYPLNPEAHTAAVNAAIAADGSIFLCDGGGNLYRLRDDGSIVWHVASLHIRDAFTCESMVVAPDPDGALYVAGTPHESSTHSRATLTRINPSDGGIDWQVDHDLYGVATIWIATSIRFLSPARLLWSFTGPPDNRDAIINGFGAHLIVSSDGHTLIGGLPRFSSRPDHREQRDKWMSSQIACLANGDILRFGFELIEGKGRELRIDRWLRPGFAPVSSHINTDWHLGYGIDYQGQTVDIYFLGERDGDLIFAILVDYYRLYKGSFVVLATDSTGRTRWLRRFPYDVGFSKQFSRGDAVLVAGAQHFLIDYDSDDPRPVGMHALIRRIQFDRAPVVAPCY